MSIGFAKEIPAEEKDKQGNMNRIASVRRLSVEFIHYTLFVESVYIWK